MENLGIYREKINVLDKQIIKLLEERLQMSIAIGNYKKENNLPVQNIQREEIIMKSIYDNLDNKEYEEAVKKIYEAIINISKSVQY